MRTRTHTHTRTRFPSQPERAGGARWPGLPRGRGGIEVKYTQTQRYILTLHAHIDTQTHRYTETLKHTQAYIWTHSHTRARIFTQVKAGAVL